MSSTPIADKREQEVENMYQFKFDNFAKLLGEDWPLDDILALVDGDIYHGDLKNLLDKGCSRELALKILL